MTRQAPLIVYLGSTQFRLLDALVSVGPDDRPTTVQLRRRARCAPAEAIAALGRLADKGLAEDHPHTQTGPRTGGAVPYAWSVTPRGRAVWTAALFQGYDPDASPQLFSVTL